MELRDYLEDVKTGYGRIVVVTDSDDNYGLYNYKRGWFFEIESNWYLKSADSLIEDFPEELQPLFEDCLDREVLEVDAGVPDIDLKIFAAHGAESDISKLKKDVVVCVRGDADDDVYWKDDEDENENSDDDGDDVPWPYRFITEEQYKAIEKAMSGTFSAGGHSYDKWMFGYSVIEKIVESGFDNVKRLVTDEYIAEKVAEAKAEYDAEDAENERRKAAGETKIWSINRYIDCAMLQYMKDVAEAAGEVDTFLAYIKIAPTYNVVDIDTYH